MKCKVFRRRSSRRWAIRIDHRLGNSHTCGLTESMSLTSVIIAMVLLVPMSVAFSQPREPRSLRAPAGTRIFLDVACVTNGHLLQRLDLYLPREGKDLPLIINIHGGAFRGGDKAMDVPLDYLARGYAVASINYRLSQDAIFPAQIEDCKAAVRWLRANASKYGLDPSHFAAWGSSAGGHLAAMVGTTGGVKEYDVGENLGVSSRVQA